MGLDDKQFLLNLQSPPWMSSSKQNNLDTPEWANRDEVDNFIQQARMTQNQQASGLKEHVIPISFEKSPNKTPAMPGFGPTPFYGAANQQFNNVVSPKVGKLVLVEYEIKYKSSSFHAFHQIQMLINLSIKDTTTSSSHKLKFSNNNNNQNHTFRQFKFNVSRRNSSQPELELFRFKLKVHVRHTMIKRSQCKGMQ